MTLSKNWNNTSYSIPEVGEFNWQSLTSFLADLSDFAQATTFQKIAIRVATTSPITVSAANDCVVISNLTVAGAVAVTLPAGVSKQVFFIVDGKGDAATNNITITPAAGNINGTATYVINVNKAAVGLAYDGTQWTVFAEFGNTTSGTGTIPRNKLAAGTASQVVINDGAGLLSSEAQLASTRGGTGVSNAGTFTYGANNVTITTSGVTSVTVPTAGTLATLAGTEVLSNKTLASPLVSGGSIDTTAAGALAIGASVGANTMTLGGATSTVLVAGNLQVDGTTTTVNSTTLDVADKNITVSKGGNNAASEGSGLTVDRTGTKGSLIYKAASASKFAIGDLGSEVDVVDLSSAQTLTNKTIVGGSNTISGIVDANIAVGAAIDATKIAAGAVDNTEFSYLNGVTSAIQTQFTNKQSLDATLTSLAAYNTNGIVTQTAADTFVGRTVTGTANRVTVSNGDGVSGNPTLDVGTDVVTLVATQALTNKDYNGGTASNTSRVTLPSASTATLAALTRKTGTVAYDTSLSKPVYDNGSAFTSFASGTGSGEINAVLNPSASDALTGYTDGTSHTTTRITSGSPLDPIITTALNVSATTTAVESSTSGSKFSITTMPTSLLNKKLKVEFYFTTEASQTWAVSVYKATTRIPLSSDASGATLLPAGTAGKFVAYFDTDSATAYSVNLTRTAGAGTAVLRYTSLIVGPGIQPQGAVVTEPQLYTPSFSGWGSVVTQKFLWRRVGSEIEIRGNFVTPTVSAAFGYIGLPTGLTIDTTKIDSTRQNELGTFKNRTLMGTDMYAAAVAGVLVYDSGFGTGSLLFAPRGSSSLFIGVNTNGLYTAGDNIDVLIRAPIAEWAGSGTLSTAQNDVEYASNSDLSNANNSTAFAYGPSGSPFPNVSATDKTKRVSFLSPIQVDDKISIEVAINSATKYVPIELTVFKSFGNTTGIALGDAIAGSSVMDIFFAAGGTSAALGGYGAAAWSAWSNVTNYRWRVKKEKAGVAVGFGLATATESGLVKGGAVPGSLAGVATAAGFLGQYLEALGSNTSITTATFSVCTNPGVSLSPGIWDVQAFARIATATTTQLQDTFCAISTSNGADAAGIDFDRNVFSSINGNATNPNGGSMRIATPMWRVIVTSTTIYYPKVAAWFTVSTCIANAHIFARRVG